MKYRLMGRTGLKVSELCLGTMTFGHSADEEESRRIVDLAIAAGVNFIDTAAGYGKSERLIARALAERSDRDQITLATKPHPASDSSTRDCSAERSASELRSRGS